MEMRHEHYSGPAKHLEGNAGERRAVPKPGGNQASPYTADGAGKGKVEPVMNPRPVNILILAQAREGYDLLRTLAEGSENFTLRWVSEHETGLQALRHGETAVAIVVLSGDSHSELRFVREARQAGCAVPLLVLAEEDDPQLGLEAEQAGAADFMVRTQLNSASLERFLRACPSLDPVPKENSAPGPRSPDPIPIRSCNSLRTVLCSITTAPPVGWPLRWASILRPRCCLRRRLPWSRVA